MNNFQLRFTENAKFQKVFSRVKYTSMQLHRHTLTVIIHTHHVAIKRISLEHCSEEYLVNQVLPSDQRANLIQCKI